jgi:hypothetical protein
MEPKRGDPDIFDDEAFITGAENGVVRFNYRGWHQELIRGVISPDDVAWACDLLRRLSPAQWQDAFRAGGYGPRTADRFIQRLLAKIDEGRAAGLRANGG